MNNLKIFIFAFNRPDLLQKQLDCFDKYLNGNYDVTVKKHYKNNSGLTILEKR